VLIAYSLLLNDVVTVIFHENVFKLALESPDLEEKLHKCFSNLFSASEAKTGLLTSLFQACYKVWMNPSSDMALRSLPMFANELVQGCLFGSQPDRFERLVEQTISIIRLQFAETHAAQMWAGGTIDMEGDARVARWLATQVILSLKPAVEAHVQIARVMIARFLARNGHLDSGTKLFHAHTPHHREKIRLWQTLVSLCVFVDEAHAPILLPAILAALGPDNQPSVRYYIEWAVVLIIRQNPALCERLFEILQQKENRPGFVMSTITVLSHLTPLIIGHPSVDSKQFLVKLYSNIIPWLASTHATLRLYAAAVLRKAFMGENLTIVKSNGDFDTLEACLKYLSERVDVKKHVDRLLSDFFFARFNPELDLNIEV
jgi:hypothetical protein